jgi:hypothetical protein
VPFKRTTDWQNNPPCNTQRLAIIITGMRNTAISNTIHRVFDIGLLDNIATAEMEQQVVGRIMKMVQGDQQKMEEKSGISSSMTEEDIKLYVEQTIRETRKRK